MTVATMAILDFVYYILAALTFTLALLSQFWYPFSYISALLLIFMFTILFVSIPLKLNWSSNLYGHLLWRFLSFLIFMIIIYALCYYYVGFERSDGSRPAFIESFYFSITSFTTLQYGEYRPLIQSRPLACIEALMGLVFFVPFFAAFGWLYCQNRLWPKSLEAKSLPKDMRFTSDPVLGGWKEIDDERTKAETEERNARIRGVPCSLCGSENPRFEKFYDVIGRTTPLALYVVHCSCGQISKPSTTAFLAAWRWKRLNKSKLTKSQPTNPADAAEPRRVRH